MKSPGLGLGDELELLAPAHAGPAAHHVDHALQRAMVMRAGLGVGMDADRAGPDLLCADARGIDRRGAVHAGRLRRVGVELVALDDPHAVVPPVHGAGRRRCMVVVVLAHRAASFG